MNSIKQVAKKIIDLLNDGYGLRLWGAGIDEDIKEEILKELEELVEYKSTKQRKDGYYWVCFKFYKNRESWHVCEWRNGRWVDDGQVNFSLIDRVIEEPIKEPVEQPKERPPFTWCTEDAHENNSETMIDYLQNYCDLKIVFMSDLGTYAEGKDSNGQLWAIRAGGNGDHYNHKIEFEAL
jgi:hypothetical protein